MSFQALARTWRPRRFDQLVGQDHVVRALTHALDHDKLHHALLFSGTRGVGKTTLARIIAKCLNCEHGVSASPCVGTDACSTCREIDEGRYVDLIEVDAASRTGVDDTRELMDNVQYAPTRGRTKVYLIDEVHMLTKHSFNALLKTLEEPPPRVQFLLATTEPEKIPVTILSRCLQFPLKRLAVTRITDRLRHVVEVERLVADDAALTELARGADGSMRDGLSLLDQAIAFGGGHLDIDSVRDMLGTIGEARVAELVDAIIDARATDALIALESLYAQGIDMRYLLDALATAWQHMATVQVVGEAVDDDSARWQEAAHRTDPHETQLFYDITLTGIRDLYNAPDPLVGVRMCVLRMLAFKPMTQDGGQAEPSSAPGGDDPVPAKTTPPAAKLSAREAMARAREQLQRKGSGSAAGRAEPESGSIGQVAPQRAQVDANDGARAAASLEKQSPVSEPDAEQVEPKEPPFKHQIEAGQGASEPPAMDRPDIDTSSEPVVEPAQASVASGDELRTEAESTRAAARGVTHVNAEIQSQDEWIDNRAAADTGSANEPSVPTIAAPRSDQEPGVDDDDRAAPELAAHGFDFDTAEDHPEDWHALVPALDVSGFAAQLANHGVCRHLDNARIELELARVNSFLATDDAREKLQAALARAWGAPEAPHLAVSVVDALSDTPAKRNEADAEKRQQDAVASIENDPIIQQLRSRLGARLRPETIKPHRSSDAIPQRDEQQ